MKKRSLDITDRAQRDLDAIFDYLAHVVGMDMARRFTRALGKHLATLALTGGPGSNQDFYRPGIRLVLHGPYKLFFELTPSSLRVLRIIHGARDTGPDNFERSAPR